MFKKISIVFILALSVVAAFSCLSPNPIPFSTSLYARQASDRQSSELPSSLQRLQQRSPARRVNYLTPFERAASDLWSPAADLFDALESMMGPMPKIPTGQGNGLFMQLDVKENPTDFHIEVDLPGVSESDIDLVLKEDVLTIRAKRNTFYDSEQDQQPQGEACPDATCPPAKQQSTYRRIERFVGEASRSFVLPEHTMPDDIKTSYADGVLRITIPKKQVAASPEIKIPVNKNKE